MKKIIEAIRSVIGPGEHLLHEPLMIGKEKEYVNEVLTSGHLSAGPWVDRFEKAVADFVGAKHAIAVMNGTCGLHACISAMKHLKEYRIPSLTFVATANAVAYGNNNIRFVEYDAYGDLVVDVLGHPHFNVGAQLRDAAQSLGSKLHGRYTGSQGTAVFSFNQNKIITTGGGGMIVTDDDELAAKIRHLVTTARVAHRWETSHNAVAWNYRMSDLSAAVGVAQMEQLPLILKAKRALAQKYIQAFEGLDNVRPILEPEGGKSNYWLNALWVKDFTMRDPLLEALHAEGIKARCIWNPIHMLPMYESCPQDDLSRSMRYFHHVICLPSSPKLGLKYA